MHSTKLFFFSQFVRISLFFLNNQVHYAIVRTQELHSFQYLLFFLFLFAFFSFVNEASCVWVISFVIKNYFTGQTQKIRLLYTAFIHTDYTHIHIQLNFSLNLLRFSSFITYFFPSSYSLLIHFVSSFIKNFFLIIERSRRANALVISWFP